MMEHLIEEEILFRLPAKTLLRFKCVCKRWLSLIESRSFIDRHYNDSDHDRLVLCRDYIDKPTQSEESIEAIPAPKFPHSEKVVELMGPQLGLFCQVNVNGDITLFNPAAKMFKRVPPLELLDVPPKKCTYGFGLDPLTRDYKIVVFRQPHWVSSTYAVCIYNSTSDSWKIIGASWVDSMGLRNSESKTFMNGVYYWVARLCNWDGYDKSILAFDMRIEKFREIQLPHPLSLTTDENDDTVVRICGRGDSLALLAFQIEWVDLWVMGEEGEWNKIFRNGPFEERFYPSCVWRNELVLISYLKDHLIMIDIATQKQRKFVIHMPEIDSLTNHSTFIFKESLVSFKGESSYINLLGKC